MTGDYVRRLAELERRIARLEREANKAGANIAQTEDRRRNTAAK